MKIAAALKSFISLVTGKYKKHKKQKMLKGSKKQSTDRQVVVQPQQPPPQQQQSNHFPRWSQSNSDTFPQNRFWLISCKPDGNCQFSAIAKALAIEYQNPKINEKLVREQVSEYLDGLPETSSEFQMALETTKYSFGDSVNSNVWKKVAKIKTPRQLASYFRTPRVYGNAATLQSARVLYDLDIYVVDSDGGNVTRIEGTEHRPFVILLIFDAIRKHYDLLSFVWYNVEGKRRVQTCFPRHQAESFIDPLNGKLNGTLH